MNSQNAVTKKRMRAKKNTPALINLLTALNSKWSFLSIENREGSSLARFINLRKNIFGYT